MSAFYWFVTVASPTAMVLSIHRLTVCFGIWFFMNVVWAYCDDTHGMTPSALQAICAAIALYGLVRWQPSPASKVESPGE